MKTKVLQYTWYPKDWQGSDVVYQIGPVDRCTYREFIDMAMENGNEIPDRSSIWWKKWNYDSLEQLKESINSLIELGAVQINGEFFTVPSCHKRLERAFRNQSNGRSGGRPAKSEKKPKENPELTEKKPRINPEETQEERPIQYNTIEDTTYQETPLQDEKFYQPSEKEVVEFFDSKGYNEKQAKKFFTHYNARKWENQFGKPVEYWKVTAHDWFDDKFKKPQENPKYPDDRIVPYPEYQQRIKNAHSSYQIMYAASEGPFTEKMLREAGV